MTPKYFRYAASALLTLTFALPAPAQVCTGDVNADGRVDGGDLGTALAWWGAVIPTNPVSVASDLDSSGQIDGADLGLLLSNWGWCAASVSGISPNQGCVLGGTEITITGAWLGQVSAVKVGGVPCTGITPISASLLKAITPPGQLGPAAVTVTTPAGTVHAPQQFTYMPSAVSSIIPNSGNVAGGSLITISGAYLSLTTSVTVGGVPATNLTVVNANTVTAVTPPGALGSADLVVSGAKGTVVIPGGFRYLSVVVPGWAQMVEERPDPAVVTDPSLRAAISATGLAWRVRDIGTQMEMLLIPPGTFQMGCVMGSDQRGCYDAELPVRQVTLSHAFYVGRYEVTQAQWMAAMGSNPAVYQGYPDSASRPVEYVTWNVVQGFLGATGLRLPTEAEWEYACRAGTNTPLYNGSTNEATLTSLAWFGFCCGGNSGPETHVVGGKAANGFGLYDTLGNVWELVNDWYASYPSVPQTDPTGPVNAAYHVIRGGSWYGGADARSSLRFFDTPAGAFGSTIGFRAARSP